MKRVDQDGPDQEEETETPADDKAAREKKIKDDVNKGKIEVAKSKAERDAASALNVLKQEKKKRGRQRGGPSTFYYEDDNRVDLDYATTQRFGTLELSPPT